MELLEFNLTSIIMLLQFILLAFFLYKFLYNPFLDATAERRNKIKNSLEEADKLRDEAELSKVEAQRELTEVNSQASLIMSNARKSSEAMVVAEKTNARQQVERMLKAASEEVETMKKDAADQMRKEAVGLAIIMASKIIEKQMDEQTQREFINNMLSSMKEGE